MPPFFGLHWVLAVEVLGAVELPPVPVLVLVLVLLLEGVEVERVVQLWEKQRRHLGVVEPFAVQLNLLQERGPEEEVAFEPLGLRFPLPVQPNEEGVAGVQPWHGAFVASQMDRESLWDCRQP